MHENHGDSITGNAAWREHFLPCLPSGSSLSPEDAVQFFRQRGIGGSERDLSCAVSAFNESDLSIKLAASYLKNWCGNDVKQLDKVPIWVDRRQEGRQVRRLLAAHSLHLENSKELSALYFLSLFDKTVSLEEIQLILASMPISLFTRLFKRKDEFVRLFSPLSGSSPRGLKKTFKKLESLALLPKGSQDCNALINHPEIQMFFKKQFRTWHPKAWRDANRYLSEYFSSQLTSEVPRNQQELLLLMQAIKHACSAGDYHTALTGLYWERVRRPQTGHPTKKLDAYNIDLLMLVNFFERDWDHPQPSIPDHFTIQLLQWAAEDLLCLKRQNEALDVLLVLKQRLVKQKKWPQAVSVSRQCRQLYQKLGKTREAIQIGQESIVYADLGKRPAELIRALLELVNLLHLNHQNEEACALFQRAEQVFKNPNISNDVQLEMEMRELRQAVRIVRGEKITAH